MVAAGGGLDVVGEHRRPRVAGWPGAIQGNGSPPTAAENTSSLAGGGRAATFDRPLGKLGRALADGCSHGAGGSAAARGIRGRAR